MDTAQPTSAVSSLLTSIGLEQPGYGKGCYIGSAKSNWGTYTNGAPNKCDFSQVLGNVFGNNVCALQAADYGFNIQTKSGSALGNQVHASNRVTGAAAGVVNVPVTPSPRGCPLSGWLALASCFLMLFPSSSLKT